MEITIKEKELVQIGNSLGFIVDVAYIRNGQILKEKKYDLLIKESTQ